MSTLNENNDTYSSQNYGTPSGLTGNFKPFSSPYLNYDPGYIPQAQPEFIFLDGGSKQRGRFELAFGQIGASCMIGAALGGANGFYSGVRATTLAGQTGKLRRTQLINHVMKSGSSMANTFGSVAVIYSAFGVILSWVRGTDDDINTVASATATGLLYKSSAGLRKCGTAGAVGLGVSLLYALWNNRDKLSNMGHYNPAWRFGLRGGALLILLLWLAASYSKYQNIVTLGFFDDILIPPNALQHPSKFNETEQAWVWEYDTGDGNKHDLFMDPGESVRFRVTAETFTETCPAGPTSLHDSQDSLESKVPYNLTGSINEPGLGLLSWWDN